MIDKLVERKQRETGKTPNVPEVRNVPKGAKVVKDTELFAAMGNKVKVIKRGS